LTMCRLCLSRRTLLAAPAVLPWARSRPMTARDVPVEPHMRLGDALPSRLTVALTLDACPGGFDDRIATALVESGIKATIFVTGLWLRENPAGLAFLLAHRDLFAVENHGELHIPPVLGHRPIYGIAVAGDLATVRHEVADGAASIHAATGTAPRWYRGATGYYSRSAMPVIQRLGFGIAGYSLNADMGASLPAHTVAERIARATNGEVIVAHINQPHRSSGAGVVAGVRELQRHGARFLRLDQLAAAELARA
jgi:peptidoglycan/xylan/chitin deacetylase (PgdA/CDA1 family)